MDYKFQPLVMYMGKKAPILIVRKIIEIAFGLIILAITSRYLTKEQFAIYGLIFTFTAIFRITSLPGLGSAVSQAFSRNNTGNFKSYISLSFKSSLIGSALLISIALWNFNPSDHLTTGSLLILSLLFPILAGMTLWRNAAVGAEKYGTLLVYDSFSVALKCFLIATCLYLFPGNLLAVIFVALLAPSLINLIATKKQLSELRDSKATKEDSLQYSIKTTIYQTPSVLANHLDRLILFYFISAEAMAVYIIAMRIPELSRAFVGETNATLGPLFAREDSYTKSIHHFAIKLWLVYLTIAIIGALFIVPSLLPLIVGENYHEAVILAQIMTIGVAFGFLGDIQFRYIKSHLHTESFLYITLSQACIDIILVASSAYLYGLQGVVYSYVLKNAAYTLVTNTIIYKKYLNNELHNGKFRG